MSDIVLKVENLYKRYRLGNVDRTAFKEDIISFWAKLQGKPDPYESYITSNELAAVKDVSEVKSRYVWSLQDINFEVKQGEVLGIIGKNGAGKSTLLKILSKTTAPTKGNVKVKGRIASLLEVGTGFHPELTGRENIYMNGAIMGMRKYEITKRLDEIIAFAGVEAYIDTPVKRYSSGMYVRLAFAVAAHLEPDILIVDEVLAVGDAEFQKKCIGKMQDVSRGEGRTVLFVSHNIAAVKQLYNKGVLLKNGNLEINGDIGSVITEYMKSSVLNNAQKKWVLSEAPGSNDVNLVAISLMLEDKVSDVFSIGKEINILYEYVVKKDNIELSTSIHLLDSQETFIFASVNWQNASLNEDDWGGKAHKKGVYRGICKIPANYLNEGRYMINIVIHDNSGNLHHVNINQVLVFNVIDDSLMRNYYFGQWGGIVRPKLERQTIFLNGN
jgi:lipopolysaccharide transport system ATP-binding protein